MSAEVVFIIISVLTAVFASGLLAGIFKLYSNKNLRLFIFLYFIFLIQRTILLIRITLPESILSSIYFRLPVYIFDEILSICFTAVLLYFIHRIFSIKPKKNIIITTVFLYLIPWILRFVFNVFSVNKETRLVFFISNIDNLPLLVYIFVISFLSYNSIRSKIIRQLGRTSLLIIFIVFFVILSDGILETFLNLDLPKAPLIIIMYSVLAIHYSFIYINFMKNNRAIVKDEFINNYTISKREKEIMELLLRGYSYRNIASMLYISMATVKTHIHNLYLKTEVKNRNELVHMVLES